MTKDPAVEEIRETRREISRKSGNDTRALIAHYGALESSYADRLAKESAAKYTLK